MENAAPAGDNDNVNKRYRVDDVEAETTFIKSALGLRNKLKEKKTQCVHEGSSGTDFIQES